MESGQVAQGMTVATAGYREDLAGRRTMQARCGEDIVMALLWTGRLESAEKLLAELRELSLPGARWRHLHGELALARGDVEAATRAVPGTGARPSWPGAIPMTPSRSRSSGSPTSATTRRGASRWPSRSWVGWTTATRPCWPPPRRGSASTP